MHIRDDLNRFTVFENMRYLKLIDKYFDAKCCDLGCLCPNGFNLGGYCPKCRNCDLGCLYPNCFNLGGLCPKCCDLGGSCPKMVRLVVVSVRVGARGKTFRLLRSGVS